jgi:2,4-dienoyl-CoA reductase-like NADH-dependent reductase (Old Yellow Enzyme family)
MDSSQNILFSPFKLGPITLRNRTIRAAAFEGMCPGNLPSEDLFSYHRSVAAGGIGMTTVAYAAVEQSGLSFPHQLLLNRDALPGLKKITDAVHKEGADCSIQIGHCGNMSKKSMAGRLPLAPFKIFAHFIEDRLMSFFVRLVGNWLVKEVPFSEGYFLEEALKFRKAVTLQLVYVGGLISREKIDEVLGNGFEWLKI